MSSGVPVIATNYGPIPEMVDDEVGSLFELGDEVDLAGKIIAELSQWDRLWKKGKGRRGLSIDFHLGILASNLRVFMKIL